MATIEHSYFGAERHGVERYSWQSMAGGDVGRGVERPDSPDKTIQFVSGTIGTSTIGVEGSMDSTNGSDGNWHPLDDAANVAIALQTDRTAEILENIRWVRPNVAAGTGTGIRIDMIVVRRPFGQF